MEIKGKMLSHILVFQFVAMQFDIDFLILQNYRESLYMIDSVHSPYFQD